LPSVVLRVAALPASRSVVPPSSESRRSDRSKPLTTSLNLIWTTPTAVVRGSGVTSTTSADGVAVSTVIVSAAESADVRPSFVTWRATTSRGPSGRSSVPSVVTRVVPATPVALPSSVPPAA
jgi:hypothetical protein